MSEDKDSTHDEFELKPPLMSREEERKAKRKAYGKAWREANKERHTASMKAWLEANKERHAANCKAWCEANPEARYRNNLSAHLRRKYGLTIAERDAMIAAQDGRCLCCKTKFGLLRADRPCVDHCHTTGRVRGILCNTCNTLIGHAADNPTILRACARHLERF
jgi:hypothetical protein